MTMRRAACFVSGVVDYVSDLTLSASHHVARQYAATARRLPIMKLRPRDVLRHIEILYSYMADTACACYAWSTGWSGYSLNMQPMISLHQRERKKSTVDPSPKVSIPYT